MNVLITGAASGLGKACALRFSEEGIKVYACDIKEFEPHLNIIPVKLDITDAKAVRDLALSFREKNIKFKAVINFAGIFFMDNFLEAEDAKLKKIFNINFFGAVNINREFFTLLEKDAKIIITTSEVAPLDPMPFNGIYNVTKTALDCYAQALRQEAGLLGTKVVTVRPGAFSTPLADGSINSMREMAERSSYFGGQAEKFAKIMAVFTGKAGDPSMLAKKIYRIFLKKHPKCVYTVHSNILLKIMSFLPKGLQVKIIKALVGTKQKQ